MQFGETSIEKVQNVNTQTTMEERLLKSMEKLLSSEMAEFESILGSIKDMEILWRMPLVNFALKEEIRQLKKENWSIVKPSITGVMIEEKQFGISEAL